MNNRLTDSLALGGYWDSFCFPCQKQTYQPEGFCSVCGWDDIEQEYMTEGKYNETISEVADRVYSRYDDVELLNSKRAANSK